MSDSNVSHIHSHHQNPAVYNALASTPEHTKTTTRHVPSSQPALVHSDHSGGLTATSSGNGVCSLDSRSKRATTTRSAAPRRPPEALRRAATAWAAPSPRPTSRSSSRRHTPGGGISRNGRFETSSGILEVETKCHRCSSLRGEKEPGPIGAGLNVNKRPQTSISPDQQPIGELQLGYQRANSMCQLLYFPCASLVQYQLHNQADPVSLISKFYFNR